MESKDENYGDFEEIVIVDVFEDSVDAVHTVNQEFIQESALKNIRRSFVIFNDNQLLQSQKSFRNKDERQHRINLRYIDPEPVRDCKYALRILAAAGFCLCLAVLLACIWYFSRFNSSFLLVVATLLGTGSVIALLLFFYQSHDIFVYKSLAAGVPLIVFDNRKPDPTEFNTFIHKLEQHIHNAQKGNTSKQQLLAGELKLLRRLKDDGMLTDQIYEDARTRIFRHKDYSAHK